MTGEEKGRRYVWVLVMVLGAAMLLASGCMWGVVKDANTGAGIAGATVTYTDSKGMSRSTTTDGNGKYVFDQAAGVAPAAGPISVALSAPGYSAATVARLVGYNDNSKATLSNLSSFWEVQNFTLMPVTAPGLSADLAVTDLYPDKQPLGMLWVRITNNGPDSVTNVTVQLSCGGETTEWASGTKTAVSVGPSVPIKVSLNPGQTAPFNTGNSLDTAKYWYNAACEILVPFNDGKPGNNYYSEIIPKPGIHDDLEPKEIKLWAADQVVVVAHTPPVSPLAFFEYELYVDGTLFVGALPLGRLALSC